MQIRDRIKELRRVPAGSLRPNPRNWRMHPDSQRDALRGILAEVGYAGAVGPRTARRIAGIDRWAFAGGDDARRRGAGAGARRRRARGGQAAGHVRPAGGLGRNQRRGAAALLADVETENEALEKLLGELAAEIPTSADEPHLADASLPAELLQIVIECRGEDEQRDLFQELTGRGLNCRLLNL